MRRPDRVHIFNVDKNGQAKIVRWKDLIEQPRLCRHFFGNTIEREDLRELRLYDDSQAPYQYGDQVDQYLAKTWWQNALKGDNERILAMAKVDAAAKFVYLQEHQAWCELPLRVLCHGLASDFEAGGPRKIETTNKLMKVYVETGHQKEAAQLGEDMLNSDNLDDWNKAKLKTNLGWVYRESMRPVEAKKHLQESLSIVDICYVNDVSVDDRHLQKARILNNLGPVYTDLGRHEEALKTLEECWELFKKHVGKDGFGSLLEYLENREKQDKLTEFHLQSANALLTKYPEVAACLNNLGSAYGKLGMYKRHSKKLEICMLLEVGYYGAEHPKVAAVLTNLGLVCQKQFQFRAAKEYLEDSLKLHEMHFGKVHEHVAEVLCNLALVCAKLKEREEDEEADEDPDRYLDRCDKILEELGEEGHAVLSAKIKNNRAILHMWGGELKEAEEGLRESLKLLEGFRESLKLLAGKSEQSPELFIEFAEIRHNLGEVLLETAGKEHCTEEERNQKCNEALYQLNASIESFEQFELKLEELKLPGASRKIEQVSSWKLLTKAYLTLGEFEIAKQQFEKGKEQLEKAKAQIEKVWNILECEREESEEQVHRVDVLHYRAVIEHKLGNLDDALYYFEKSLKEGEKHKKKIKKKFMVQINSNLALTCRFLQAQETDDSRKKSLEEREEQALQFCVDSLKSLHEQGVEPAEPTDKSVKEKPLESEEYLQLLTRLGLVQVDRKKYTEAECHLDRALQSKLSCLEIQGQDCEKLAQIVMIVDALGFVYAQLQNISKEAQLQNISKEKKMLEHLIDFKADGEKISRILKRLCAACMKIENIEVRIEFAKELLGYCKELGDVEHAHVLLCLATTFLEEHNLKEVKNCCSHIPNLCRNILELDKDANTELLKSLSEAWLWLGEEYVSQEMYEDACSVLKECLDINSNLAHTCRCLRAKDAKENDDSRKKSLSLKEREDLEEREEQAAQLGEEEARHNISRFSFFGHCVQFCFIEAFGVSSLFKPPSIVQMRLLSGSCTTCSRKWCGSRQTSEAPSGSTGMLFSRGDATCFAPKSFQSRLEGLPGAFQLM